MAKVIGWAACACAMLLLVVAMVSGLAGTSVAAATPTRTRVTGAWVRLPVVPGRPGAGYFVLHGGDAPAELTAVTSPVARVELHSMSMSGDVMRMDRLPSVRVAPHSIIVFKSGGAHLMLFDLSRSTTPGASVPLTFHFSDGSSFRIGAPAVATGANAPNDLR